MYDLEASEESDPVLTYEGEPLPLGQTLTISTPHSSTRYYVAERHFYIVGFGNGLLLPKWEVRIRKTT